MTVSRLQFMEGATGNVGLEAPMGTGNALEVQEALTALLRGAIARGYVSDVPASEAYSVAVTVRIERDA